MKRNLSILAAFCLLVTAAFSVSAQNSAEVKKLIDQGVEVYKNKNYVEAEKFFLQAQALEETNKTPMISRDVRGYVYLADIYTRIDGNARKGNETFEKYLKFDESSAWAYRSYASISLYKPGALNRTVIDYLTEAVLLEPKDARNYYLRSLALSQYVPLALNDLERAIKADPKFASAYDDRGLIYLKRGEYDKALAEFEKYHELEPTKPQIYHSRRGITLILKGDTVNGIADLTKSIGASGEQNQSYRADSFFYRGYGNLVLKNRAAAQTDMIEVGKLSTSYKSDRYYRLATDNTPDEKCRNEKGLFNAIEDVYKKFGANNHDERDYQIFRLRMTSVNCEPSSAKVLFNFLSSTPSNNPYIDFSLLQKYRTLTPDPANRNADFPNYEKRINAAVGQGSAVPTRPPYFSASEFDNIRLLDDTTNFAFVADMKANIAEAKKLVDGNRFHAGIAILNRVIEMEPGNVAAHENLARAFVIKRAVNRAFDEAQTTLKLAPNSSTALNVRGLVKGQRGDYDGAIADYTAAIKFDPTNDKAFFNRGRLLAIKKDYTGALQDFTAADKIKPDTALYLINRGHAYFGLNDNKKAFAEYLIASSIDQNNSEARLGMIMSLDKIGDAESIAIANKHHKWLIENARDYEGLKLLANRNPNFAATVTKSANREQAIKDLNYYASDMRGSYEVYSKGDEKYGRPNVSNKQLIDWFKQDIGTLEYIIKLADKLESEARRVLNDASMQHSAADRTGIQQYIDNAIRVRGFCRDHIADAKEQLKKLGAN